MIRAATEIQDVKLGNPQVLEELPTRVRQTLGPRASQLDGPVGNGVVEGRMGVAAGQKVDNKLA
jgi:hypothetical protein